ncbi:D-hexose-6-phosphate mutarotase [Alginatibacterium sediminis]|uniref:Putative glucose-6-phosphate 1-epimerase n=1 Tax=Alginatibacterium sediminis TaxID=2164068 RepID=A0A420EFV4_9ALTE|nr:D-hexose-6-phosphate mutarotase [Alginatibacterium sediminis]RKF19585.1 D-hexose-6-phosphate mutarotase [Alginatibacterium sediminis]
MSFNHPNIASLNLIKKHHLFLSEYQDADQQCYFFVETPFAELYIASHGAHVLSYKPKDQAELLWLSDTSAFTPNKAIRGGVPICWPFFGPYKGQITGLETAPNHGFARTQTWELSNFESLDDEFVMLWRLPNAELQQILGFEFEVEYKVSVGKQLKLELTTRNLSQDNIVIGGALHSYFNADITSLRVDNLANHYLDSVDKKSKQQQIFSLSPQTDRIYPSNDKVISLRDQHHQVSIENIGNDSVVVWNPGHDLASGMADVHENAEQQYLCVESAQSSIDFVIKPGTSHSLIQVIR